MVRWKIYELDNPFHLEDSLHNDSTQSVEYRGIQIRSDPKVLIPGTCTTLLSRDRFYLYDNPMFTETLGARKEAAKLAGVSDETYLCSC